MAEQLIDKEQLAKLVDCSPRTVQEKCAAKKWPYTMPAGKLMFKPEHVAYILALGESWPDQQSTEEQPAPAAPPTPRRRRRTPDPALPTSSNVTPLRSRPAPRLASSS